MELLHHTEIYWQQSVSAMLTASWCTDLFMYTPLTEQFPVPTSMIQMAQWINFCTLPKKHSQYFYGLNFYGITIYIHYFQRMIDISIPMAFLPFDNKPMLSLISKFGPLSVKPLSFCKTNQKINYE